MYYVGTCTTYTPLSILNNSVEPNRLPGMKSWICRGGSLHIYVFKYEIEKMKSWFETFFPFPSLAWKFFTPHSGSFLFYFFFHVILNRRVRIENNSRYQGIVWFEIDLLLQLRQAGRSSYSLAVYGRYLSKYGKVVVSWFAHFEFYAGYIH